MHDPTGMDPFAHLHEEEYEEPFNAPVLGASGMIAMGGRKVESLDGDWNFTIDPFCEGLRQRWFTHDDTPPHQWTQPRDRDDGGWQTLAVPGCWNLARPQWLHYEGSAWYSREAAIEPAASGERIFLLIGAASGRSRVFVNGRFLGVHHGSSAPFFVEITDAVTKGLNRLLIQVDNTRRADGVPMHHFDWFNHGGLHRSVGLVRAPDCFIRSFQLALAPDRETIRIAIDLSRPVDATCRISVGGLGDVQVSVRGGKGVAEWRARPRLWRPGDPVRYRIVAECAGDRVEELMGFRTVEVRNHEILLNGQAIELRGVCVHEDDRDTGRTSSQADIRRRFAHVRELGANAVRLAHYLHDERAALIADELGLLLWEEIPVYWAIDFANPATLADARNQLSEMIARDFNRASVILWGVGNENADTDQRLDFMRALADTAKSLDPSRLTVAACLINRVHFRIEDRLTAHLDVIGINEYFGWYEPGFANLERLLANSRPEKPVLISETGADAVAGLHGAPGELFTEEHQADMLANQVRINDACGYVAGIFPWLLYDFRSERRQTTHQRGWNRKGLIAEDKTTRKAGFAALQEAYRHHFRKGDQPDGRG